MWFLSGVEGTDVSRCLGGGGLHQQPLKHWNDSFVTVTNLQQLTVALVSLLPGV